MAILSLRAWPTARVWLQPARLVLDGAHCPHMLDLLRSKNLPMLLPCRARNTCVCSVGHHRQICSATWPCSSRCSLKFLPIPICCYSIYAGFSPSNLNNLRYKLMWIITKHKTKVALGRYVLFIKRILFRAEHLWPFYARGWHFWYGYDLRNAVCGKILTCYLLQSVKLHLGIMLDFIIFMNAFIPRSF